MNLTCVSGDCAQRHFDQGSSEFIGFGRGIAGRFWRSDGAGGFINGQAGQYGQVNYAAAKSGIHGFTKALAQEGARHSVTANAIAPGYGDTEMVRAVPPDVLEKIVAKIPRGRLGTAEDIAHGVVFLTATCLRF